MDSVTFTFIITAIFAPVVRCITFFACQVLNMLRCTSCVHMMQRLVGHTRATITSRTVSANVLYLFILIAIHYVIA